MGNIGKHIIAIIETGNLDFVYHHGLETSSQRRNRMKNVAKDLQRYQLHKYDDETRITWLELDLF